MSSWQTKIKLAVTQYSPLFVWHLMYAWIWHMAYFIAGTRCRTVNHTCVVIPKMCGVPLTFPYKRGTQVINLAPLKRFRAWGTVPWGSRSISLSMCDMNAGFPESVWQPQLTATGTKTHLIWSAYSIYALIYPRIDQQSIIIQGMDEPCPWVHNRMLVNAAEFWFW